MDANDAPSMQSYPSPNGGADNNAPFYSTSSNPQQSSLGQSDDLAALQRDLAPIMHAGQGAALSDAADLRGHPSAGINHHYENNNHVEHAQARHALDQMSNQYNPPTAVMTPRKRSKVSRACDECRRKKIRCDATDESEKLPCSNCKRVGALCKFSRVPMKRGPSKGYIKELADRLNTLEGAIQANEIPLQQQYMQQHDGPLQRHGSADFSPASNAEMSPRKRTYSAMSGDFNSPYPQGRQQPRDWAEQNQGRHQLPHLSSNFATPQAAQNIFREPNYSPNGLPPNPQWRSAPETAQRGSFDGMTQAEHGLEHALEWNETLIDAYYKSIHTTYPLLVHSKVKLSAIIAACPPALKDAFYDALYSAAQSFTSPNASGGDRTKAHQVLTLQSNVSASGNLATNLVYLQTMMLMAIEAANRGPIPKGQGLLSPSMWLGSAIGLAYSLKIHIRKPADKQSEGDADSDDKLARRVWWCLVMMDKWHASGNSSPLLIPDRTAILNFEDQALLGDELYHLARLSMVLGHFSAVEILPVDVPTFDPNYPAVFAAFAMLLRGELERCREAFPQTFFPPSKAPVIHLCYWFLRLLLEIRLASPEKEDILEPTLQLVTQLTHNSTFMSPLTHHITALTTLTLIELTSYDKTKETAEAALKALVENRIAPSGWDAAIRDSIITKLGRGSSAGAAAADSQHALTASQGLQRLADLATATEGDRADAAIVEARKEGEQTNASPTEPLLTEGLKSLKDVIHNGYMSGFGA